MLTIKSHQTAVARGFSQTLISFRSGLRLLNEVRRSRASRLVCPVTNLQSLTPDARQHNSQHSSSLKRDLLAARIPPRP